MSKQNRLGIPCLSCFPHVYIIDPFYPKGLKQGNPLVPVCLVAEDLVTGVTTRRWFLDQMAHYVPYDTGKDSVFITWGASAEASIHLTLGWPIPTNIIDLLVEVRHLTNGKGHRLPVPFKLDSVANYIGVNTVDSQHKRDMQTRILKGRLSRMKNKRKF